MIDMKPRHVITRPIRAALHRIGYDIVPAAATNGAALPLDFEAHDREDWHTVSPFTMVLPERIYTLTRAVDHIIAHDLPGAIVECGTWKGGCVMAVLRALLRRGITDRHVYLYDLFGGAWPEPSEHDVHGEVRMVDLYREMEETPPSMVYSLDEVRQTVLSVGYPEDKLHFIAGPVEETLSVEAPEDIALLRLDTDFYASTKAELELLYPRLVAGGILILDDYGEWNGARLAVDEYFEERKPRPYLCRVDQGSRLAIKPHIA